MLQAVSLKHKVVTFLEGKKTVLKSKDTPCRIYTITKHHSNTKTEKTV